MFNRRLLVRNSLIQTFIVVALVAIGILGVGLRSTEAAAVIGPPFDSSYLLFDLGPVPGVPLSYGGLTTLFNDPNTLLIGGNANEDTGLLYSIGVTRDVNGHIIGYAGSASIFAQAAFNDGGVSYGPDNVLFTVQWPENKLGQLKPGSTVTDKVIDLAALGVVGGGPGGGTFVPVTFAGAGKYKIVTWPDGIFYTLELAPDGTGTFKVVSVTQGPTIGGEPEGFIYVKGGNPGFAVDSMLVSEFTAGNIAAYELDANGDPIVATRRDFITGLDGAEGAFIDPLTGDFMFSTFGTGSDRIFRIQGFDIPVVPEPSSLVLLAVGLAAITGQMLRRR